MSPKVSLREKGVDLNSFVGFWCMMEESLPS